MKWIKRLVKLFFFLVLLAAIGVGVLFFCLNGIAKRSIETGGTYALGVPTALGDIDISLFSGSCELNNLRVENPKNFTFPSFLRIDHGEFSIDVKSLSSDTVKVNHIRFKGVELSIEKTKAGSNYQVILDHLQQLSARMGTGQTTNEPDAQDAQAGKNIVIGEILIEDVSVNLNVNALGLGVAPIQKTIRLSEPIRLTNLGTAEDAKMQMAHVVGIIVKTMLSEVIRQAGGLLPDIIGNELGKGLDGLGKISQLGAKVLKDGMTGGVEDAKQAVDKLTGSVSETAGKLTETTGGLGKDLSNKTQDALKGLGGLFGKKKEPTPAE